MSDYFFSFAQSVLRYALRHLQPLSTYCALRNLANEENQ